MKTEKRHPPQSPENEWKGFKTPLAHRPVSCPAVFGLGTVHRHLVTTWDYFPSLEASPHWNWNVIIGVIQLKYQHQSIWTSSVLFAVFQCLELRQSHHRANGDRLLLLGTDWDTSRHQCTHGGQTRLLDISSRLPPRGSQRLNLGSQFWWQASAFTDWEPSSQPLIRHLKLLKSHSSRML